MLQGLSLHHGILQLNNKVIETATAQVNKINRSLTFGLIRNKNRILLPEQKKRRFVRKVQSNCLLCLRANVFTPLGLDRMLRKFCPYVINK